MTSALPISVVPASPPSQGVRVLGQVVHCGPSYASHSRAVVVGIGDGRDGASICFFDLGRVTRALSLWRIVERPARVINVGVCLRWETSAPGETGSSQATRPAKAPTSF